MTGKTSNGFTFSIGIKLKTGETVPFESLSKERKKECVDSMMTRLGQSMSDYFTQNIEEYIKI